MSSPTLTRRALIAGAGTAIASAALAVPALNAVRADDVCSLAIQPDHDPLLEIIHAYRQGLVDFNLKAPTHSNEAFDAYADATFHPPMEAMEAWEGPTPTLRSAMEAVRVAFEELRDCGDTDFVLPMLAAAVAHFDAIA